MFLQFFGREMVDEEDAVKMVDLVLRGTGEEPLRLEVKGVAIQILTDDTNTGGALHFVMETRHAEASLDLGASLMTHGMDLGIDHHQRHEGIEFEFPSVDPSTTGSILEGRHDIDHGELKGAADLMRSQSAAILRVHGFDHLLGEGKDGVIDILHLAPLAAECWMTIFDHLEGLDLRRALFSSAAHGIRNGYFP
jgi:hypothetical protein